MSQTGTKIIQILGIAAFLILALSMLMSWKTHRELRNFHDEKFAFLKNELKAGMTKEEVRSKLTGMPYQITETTETRWLIRWFNEESKDAQHLQTERLGVPTSAELIFSEDGKLSRINGLE
ncbi:MAG: hypothetical protein IKK25_03840 [Lentisphaeria bacterium]|nr:hypothetical protein [Lentisphaeria bacterium]